MIVETDKHIVHIIPDIVYKIDADGYFQYLNESVHILNYEPHELIGLHYTVLLHPEDTMEIQRSAVIGNKKVLNRHDGQPQPLLFDERRTGKRITKKLKVRLLPKGWEKSDNAAKDIHCEIYSIGLYEGDEADQKTFSGTLGIIRDITGLVETEKNIYRVKKFYQSLISQASDIYMIIATDGDILSLSPSIKKYLDYDAYDLIGESIQKIIHPDDSILISNILAGTDFSDEYSGDIELKTCHRNRSLRHGRMKFRTVIGIGNEVSCHVIIIHDITSYKKTEQLLQDSDDRTHMILEEIQDSYFETDNTGLIIFCNKAACSFTGHGKNQLVGMNFSELFSGESRVSISNSYITAGQDKKHIQLPAVPFHAPGGHTLYLDITISPVVNVNDDIIGFRIITRDVTEKKIELDSLHDEKERARESDRIKSHFIASMSHEIRTPMNSIIGFTDLLMDDERDLLKSEYLSQIKNSSELLLSLINDILDLSRIEADKIKIENTGFNLKTLLDEIIALARMLIIQYGKEIIIDYSISNNVSHHIISDPTRLKQIIINLITNAIKFTERGRIDINCVVAGPDILECTVKDTGIGIPADKQHEIFMMFHQLSNSDYPRSPGTGVGLTIVKRLIMLMGGDIRVESRTDNTVGTSFIFTIPYHQAPGGKNIPAAAADEKNAFRELTVLIADDDRSGLFLLKRIMEKYGFHVITAENGHQAIGHFEANSSIDFIIADIQMPIMDGIEVARQVRIIEKRSQRKKIPLIALTAAAMKGDQEKFISAGFDAYVPKPLNRDCLLEVIRSFFHDFNT